MVERYPLVTIDMKTTRNIMMNKGRKTIYRDIRVMVRVSLRLVIGRRNCCGTNHC